MTRSWVKENPDMAGGLYKFGLNSLTCLFADMGLFQDTSINALGAIKLTQPA